MPEWQVAVALGDRYPNFSICGIPYFLSKEIGAIDRLLHRKAADIRALGVELLLDRPAEQIQAAEHRVVTRGQDGIFEHLYDKLVIATGAASIRPLISGLDLPGVFLLRWAGDALRRSIGSLQFGLQNELSSSGVAISVLKWRKP